MAGIVLFTVERHGIKAEIVELPSNSILERQVRLTLSPSAVNFSVEGATIWLTPEQGDILSSLSSIARAGRVAIEHLRESGEQERLARGRS